MTIRSKILLLSASISAGCIMLAFILNGTWQILLALPILVAVWFVGKRYTVFWASTSMMAAAIITASAGILSGVSLPLLIIGCTTALAAWDMVNYIDSLGANPENMPFSSLDKQHLRSLGLAVSAGALAALITSFVKFQIPFILVVGLVLLAVGSFVIAVRNFILN